MDYEDIKVFEKDINYHAYRYSNNIKSVLADIEDLKQIGWLGVLRGYEKYEEGKGASLRTFVNLYIKSEISNYIIHLKRKSRYNETTISLNNELNNDDEGLTLEIMIGIEDTKLEEVEYLQVKKKLLHSISDTDLDILNSYYIDEELQSEIAKRYNLTQAAIGVRIKKITTSLKIKYFREVKKYERNIK